MKEVFINIMLAVFGFILIIFGSTGILGIYGVLLGFFGGILMFVVIVKDIGVILNEGLLPFWRPKKKGEKISFTLTRTGKLVFIPVIDKYDGVLYYNGKFFANDVGDSVQTASGRDACLSLLGLGVTLSPKQMAYTAWLDEEKKCSSYDKTIEKALGDVKYKAFLSKFRGKHAPKDKFGVKAELDFLLSENLADELKTEIVGETYSFRHFIHYLKYAYNTLSIQNAIERERLDIMQRMDDYSAKAKNAINYAIAFIIVMVGLGIAAYIFSGVDMGGMLNFFGG